MQLLEDAERVAVDESDRALLLGRLATEMLYIETSDRAHTLAEAALEHAVRSGDRRTRIEVSLRHFDATWAPHFLDARRAEIACALDLSGEPDVVDRCFSFSRAAAAAIEAVDLRHADEMLAEMFALADRHDLSVVTHAATLGSRLAHGAGRRHRRSGTPREGSGQDRRAARLHNAAYGTANQLFCIAWARGRFGDLLPVLELADPSAKRASRTGSC